MASVAAMAAVDARIATYWNVVDPDPANGGVAIPYLGLNETGDAPAGVSAFLAVQYPIANAQQISIGAPGAEVFREEGGIGFVLSIARGQGIAWWTQQLEALTANFRAKKFAGVNTWAPTSPVFDDTNDRASHYRLTAVVPYYLDALG